jgi:hypothetical protein
MEQDRTFGLAVDFALTQVLLGMVTGTARITNLSVEDGYLTLSIRAKVDSIQLSSDGVRQVVRAPPALAPTDSVGGKPDQADAAGPIHDAGEGVRLEDVPDKAALRLTHLEDLDEKPALPPTAPDLEELDDVARVPGEVQAARPKRGFELEDLE